MKAKEKVNIVEKNLKELYNIFIEINNSQLEYIIFEKIVILIHWTISHKWINELSKRKKIDIEAFYIFEALRHFFAHNSIFNSLESSYIDLHELKKQDKKNYEYFVLQHKPSLYRFIPHDDPSFKVYITIDFTKKKKHRIYLQDTINIRYSDETIGNNKEKMRYIIRIYQLIFEEYQRSI